MHVDGGLPCDRAEATTEHATFVPEDRALVSRRKERGERSNIA